MVKDTVFAMDPYEPVDNKYAFGLAASFCLLPLPILYLISQPMVLILHAPWTRWLLAFLYVVTPLLAAFVILYHGPLKTDWSRPKRVLLGILLSLLIVGADLMFIVFLGVLSCFEFSNVLFADPPSSRGVY